MDDDEVVARPAAKSVIIACGALAREILASLEISGLTHVELRCLPALLHNSPDKIPAAVAQSIREAKRDFEHVFVAYADCGTGGQLDRLLESEGVGRLPGAHCYAFYTGVARFSARQDRDMRAFFLTDFLVRQFDTLVIEGLGLDRHPELRADYFGNYEKVVYLAQTHDAALLQQAQSAARKLQLMFEHRYVGLGDLSKCIEEFGRQP